MAKVLKNSTAPAPPPITVARSNGDPVAIWSELTRNGNLAFDRGDDVRAREVHEAALIEAERLLDAAIQTNDPYAARFAPFLFGASCNNVVELARRQGDTQTEGIFLYRAVARFIDAAESPRAQLALRSRCLLHLKVASAALYRYFDSSGMWDAAAALSERTNTVMFMLRRQEAAASTKEPLSAEDGFADSDPRNPFDEITGTCLARGAPGQDNFFHFGKRAEIAG
jgi:hypothetical protein